MSMRASMRKGLILVSIIVITIAATYALIHYVGTEGFAFAWALNFLLMAGALTFTETLKSELTSSYYTTKPWERGGRIYELFGVNLFRKLLVLIGWEQLNKKTNPVERNTQALVHLHYRTKQSELGHLIILIIVLAFNLVVAFRFGILQSLWLLALNVVLNLYPIILQRFNRPRLERAIRISAQR
jgi:hypothetical protein